MWTSATPKGFNPAGRLVAITPPHPHALGMNEVEIRPARAEDAAGIADVYVASFAATYEFPRAHSDADTRRWIAEVLLTSREVWVATTANLGPIVAMMALTDEMVDQLYVAPGWTGQGIGSRLIGLAQSRRPNGLDLYTFQVNRSARRFYERHGFVEVASSDGSQNEERQPDVRYAWRPVPAGAAR
jgi:GNAT superfamily N-acetyltransferase